MKKTALTAIALLLMIGTARAIEAPVMKEGFWKIHTVTTDGPGTKPDETTYSLCRDHAYDKEAEGLANGVMKSCSVNNQTRQGDKILINAVCTIGGSTITTRSVITILSDTSVHSDETTTYSPAFYGQTQGTRVMDQTYIGACPSGFGPGDRIFPDGRIERHSKH